MQEALGGASKVEIVRSIVIDQKSIKNDVELEGFRQSTSATVPRSASTLPG